LTPSGIVLQQTRNESDSISSREFFSGTVVVSTIDHGTQFSPSSHYSKNHMSHINSRRRQNTHKVSKHKNINQRYVTVNSQRVMLVFGLGLGLDSVDQMLSLCDNCHLFGCLLFGVLLCHLSLTAIT